ncbi:hypothetical protein yaldo0001_15750 [Yersinia aldovae ATCC 35236]|nr:hypothetical protein yaldo0001_15750 [Yersinia aldovae ATCC 35236]
MDQAQDTPHKNKINNTFVKSHMNIKAVTHSITAEYCVFYFCCAGVLGTVRRKSLQCRHDLIHPNPPQQGLYR